MLRVTPYKYKTTKSEGLLSTRSANHIVLNKYGVTVLSKITLINDATRVWNAALNCIKQCSTITGAKKAIKLFVITLPM